jgi:signal transduction histidine kinase
VKVPATAVRSTIAVVGGVVDRYRLEARLGSGGGGEVYRARDEATGDVVALKLVPFERAGEGALHAEFEVASSLRHPNIVRVREYGFSDEGKSYFTMDVVDGVSIVDHQIDLDLATLYRLASQLCSSLSYLHGRGLLHGDLKPSNVLVAGCGTGARIQLLDFGLARHRKSAEGGAGGTMGYMAPETMMSGRADVRSELYSMGAVLYHVVTQSPPMGPSAEDFERVLLGGGLPPVRERAPGLDPEWARLIDRLVAKEPGARPVSAVEAQEMLDAWAEASGTERVGPPVADADRPAPPIGGSLVGRRVELEAASDVVAGARRGQGALLYLHGEAGIGKTRLLEEVRGRAQLGHVRVLWATCGGAAARPFSVAGQLVRLVEPSLPGAIVRRYDEAITVLCASGAPTGEAAPADARLRILSAAANLLLDVAAHEPLAVIVDDVHAADRDAVDFLRALAVRVSSARVALFCAGRDDALPGGLGGDLEGEPFVRTTRLERLDEGAVRELVEAALGEVEAERTGATPDLAEAVHRASDGNPLLAEEALRSWVDIGGLVRARGTWILRPDIVRSAARPSPSVQEAIAARLGRLERVPRRLLVAESVLGDSFEATLLAEVANVRLERVEAALGGFVAQHLLRAEGARRYRFVQGLVREVVYDRTPPDGRRRVHIRALELLLARRERGEPVELDELARHALGAGDTTRGPALCLEAAREAERACALERAVEWYRALLSLGGVAGETLGVHEKIADLALAAGKADLARSSLEQALALAPAEARLRLRRKRAEAQLLGGDPRRARQECEEALLQEAGAPAPDRLQMELVRCRCLYRTGELDEALALVDLALSSATGLNRPDLWVAAQKLRGNVLALRGDIAAAITAVRVAGRAAKENGDDLTSARALGDLSMCYGMRGQYVRALAAARSERRTYQRMGAVTDLARAENAVGLAALVLGRWAEAERAFHAYALAAETFGRRWARTAVLTNQSILARERGELSRAVLLAERSVSFGERWGLQWPMANALQQLGIARLRQRDLAGACSALEQARAVAASVDAGGLSLAIDGCLAEVALEKGDLDGARRLAEVSLRTAGDTGAARERPGLRLLLARTARQQGRLGEARALVDEALEELARAQAPLDYARAELERAHILRASGEVGLATDLADAARKIFDQLGAAHDLGQVDRLLGELRDDPDTLRRSLRSLEALVEASRSLAGVLDLPVVLDRVADQLLAVTGGERAFLLLVEPSGQHEVRAFRNIGPDAIEDPAFRGSRGIVDEVARTGRTVCVTDVADDVRFRSRRSVRELGLRSMICVPLQMGGRVIGVAYVDSARADGQLFRSDVATVEALAAQAAIAIETARLYQDLKGKNELIGILAHELRTPLTAILGFTELLERVQSLAPDRRERYLGAVKEHGERMNRLIQQVLDLSRLGSDTVQWAFRAIEPAALVVPTVLGLEPVAAARGVQLATEVAEGLPAIAADRDRLVQVLSNLVANAVSFSEAGAAVTVTVRSAELPGGRPAVEIRVRDEGPGIPSSEVPTLFEPFVRGSGAVERPGAGLGLHICQTIVRRHGGRIWVETRRGGGSTFVFQIPAVEAPPAPPRAAAG